ncbi:type 1 fimbrial protein [Thiopseudomonas alkaliphila]|uniref:Type 1 fimbrial protein n=1 Tax=Thiopseudomonas alkaliphila TaxID=1697053 RepID=A0AAW7DU25_9GAMM|nr:fimbrial protein [Thiopseudomonas alkaliphila]MDM1697344.1 type 1 fimbrial protein [Thiopseudomonas alkaliphila]
MKKIPSALVLALGLASGSAFAASSGTITINGQVMDQTCTIVGAADQIVTLATVAKADLAALGEEAAKQSFTIQLENCAAGNVSAFFSADTASLIDPATNTLVNQGTATNVNVALYEENGSRIELGNAAYVYADKKTVAAVNGPATLMYSAGYYATGESTAGTVSAVANYTISYQ